MQSGIQKIEEVIAYIEENIAKPLDCGELARKMNLSVYEFRRIFSFVVGCPVSEYIRKRRISLAACEIAASDKPDMLALSQKYGYSTQSSFSKAFSEQHGVSPSAYLKEKCKINLFTRPEFDLKVSGREEIPFEIIKSEAFYIKGFSAVSVLSDTCCCENVWSEFYDSGADKKICGDKIYVSYKNEGENVLCTIGEKADEGEYIPQSRFAVFKLNTVEDDAVNEIYSKILYKWLASANLTRKEEMQTIEVYPFDMSEEGFEWEIRIPIE